MRLRVVDMANMENHLKSQLELALEPDYCEVVNESSRHSGPATESHFKLIVVSEKFIEMRLIDRHRFINKLFAEELNDIHALAMHTYTPEEWRKRSGAPLSPQCSSKSK
jgi:BolA protein